jgi:hypothetical protein
MVTLESPEAFDSLRVHLPAIVLEQLGGGPIALSRMCLGQFLHGRDEFELLGRADRHVGAGWSGLLEQFAGPALGHFVASHQVGDRLSPPSRAQNFIPGGLSASSWRRMA